MEPPTNLEFVKIDEDSSDVIPAFLELGKSYLTEAGSPAPDKREIFLQSMLQRQRERDRWLLLLKSEDVFIGFLHAKIDKDERPGWGCILEFFIAPPYRMSGWGARMAEHILDIMRSKGVKQVWLTSDPKAEGFWRSMGFALTEVLASNNCRVMTRNI